MSELEPTRTYSNPTATDVLRRMLDERGVEWDYGIAGPTTTKFSINRIDLTFTPLRGGLVCSTILTPAQAIAATLGSCSCSNNCTNGERTGTCRNVAADGFECSECKGWWVGPRGTENPMLWGFRFCPTCGAKVVGSTTNDVDVEVAQ